MAAGWVDEGDSSLGVGRTRVVEWKVSIEHLHTLVCFIVLIMTGVSNLVGKVYNLCRV